MECTKSGYIEHRVPKKKGKFMWFSLHGSTLFAYKDRGSDKPQSTFQLKDTTISLPADKKLTIDIMNGNSLIISLIATSKAEFESWAAVLESASVVDASTAPQKEKQKKNRSVGMRVQNVVGSKVASSELGKAAVKVAVNEETKLLIVSLKKIIAKVESKSIADEIEGNLMKIITKSFILEKHKKITLDQFLEADGPLREAFESLVEMRDYRHRMRPETVQQRLNLVHERLGCVETIITEMLVEHLKPANIQRIARTFGLLASQDFLDKAWGTPELEEERDLLTDAMNRYTQFHF